MSERKCEYEQGEVYRLLHTFVASYVGYRLTEHKCYEHGDKGACARTTPIFEEASRDREILADKLEALVKCLEGTK